MEAAMMVVLGLVILTSVLLIAALIRPIYR
jgi:hypothetical protein